MLHLALALLLASPAIAQEDPPKPPRPPKDGRPDDMRKREREILEKIEGLQREADTTDDEGRRKELRGQIRQLNAELEKLRSGMMKGPEKGDKRPGDLQAEIRRTEERLKDPNVSEAERAKLTQYLEDLHAKLEMGRQPRGPMPPEPPFERGERGMDPRQMDEVRAYAKEFEPDTLRRIQQLTEEGRREELGRLMADAARRMHDTRELKERNPEEFRRRQEIGGLENETWQIADKLRKADGDNRARLKEQLAEKLGTLFDAREQQRARELAELEKRVAELRQALEKRRQNKEQIVGKRAQQMLGEEFEW